MDVLARDLYLNKIKPFIDKDLIKVLIGQRRVGKSFFLLQIMDYLEKEFKHTSIIYINKEDLKYDSIKDYKDLTEYAQSQKSNNKKHALFVDEVQDIEHFEKALRHLAATGDWDIYITGSNADLLSGELATYLSGRYIEIKIFPLSFNEFIQFHRLDNSQQTFNKFMKFGGLPYLRNLPLEDQVVFDYLKNIFTTILYRDIIARYNPRNTAFLERLCRYIADNIGNLVSAKKISDYLKSQKLSFSNNIVLDYLNHLHNAFLVVRVPRNDLKGKRILEIGEKLYFNDLGLRHALSGYKTNDISQIFENIVLNDLFIKGYDVSIGKIGAKEIDFVCDKADNRVYIQVTLSLADEKVKEREIGNLLMINDNFRKIIVTGDEYNQEMIKGIEIWNIRRFLAEFS